MAGDRSARKIWEEQSAFLIFDFSMSMTLPAEVELSANEANRYPARVCAVPGEWWRSWGHHSDEPVGDPRVETVFVVPPRPFVQKPMHILPRRTRYDWHTGSIDVSARPARVCTVWSALTTLSGNA